MILGTKDKRILPRLSDKEEYLYVEHARIEQDDASICIIQGRQKTPVPVAAVSCLIMGPGTTVTHRAMQALGDARCLVVWGGEDLRAFYAVGFEKDRKAGNLLRQARMWADENAHLAVVRRMYAMRFADIKMDGMSLEEMRGLEGLRMKDLYERTAEANGAKWDGRTYDRDDFESGTAVNKALTTGNQLLYNVCRAAVHVLGYSPALGFIHTGRMDSFVYDLADLYKADIVIPVAFSKELESYEGRDFGREVRERCHLRMKNMGLLKQIPKDMEHLFGAEDCDPSGLWDGGNGVVEQSVNYYDNMKK